MSDWKYAIHVCPFCGAPASYEGGYDGSGWIFECDHDSHTDEYGSVDALTVDITPSGELGIEQLVAVHRRVHAAVRAARSGLEAQRQQLADEKAERERVESERRAAMTPEARAKEDAEREMMHRALRNLVPDIGPTPLLTRQIVGPPVAVEFRWAEDDLTP